MRIPAIRIGAAALITCAITTGATLTTAAPAVAASYNGACGNGHRVVAQKDIGTKGTVFLTYNANNGKNCVVTIRDNPGSAVLMFAGIARESDSAWYDVDKEYYTTYAGPVYRYAPNSCVTWGGSISGTYVGDENTNCG